MNVYLVIGTWNWEGSEVIACFLTEHEAAKYVEAIEAAGPTGSQHDAVVVMERRLYVKAPHPKNPGEWEDIENNPNPPDYLQ